MNAAHLSYSISRAFGGIFEICRRTTQTLAAEQAMRVSVFGAEDEFTSADLPSWRPLQPRAFPVCGPKAYGFTPCLARALDAASPDVVHVHGLWTFSTLAARRWALRPAQGAARRRARPYVVTIHGMLEPWALRQSRWKKTLAAALFERASLRTAACLHVNTDEERRQLRAYGLGNPVCIIPNGVDLPNCIERLPAPWAGRVPASAKVLLYLGRLHPKKGLPNLLRAWAAVRRAGQAQAGEWRLALAGWDQGGHLAELQARVSDAQLGDSVLFLGPQFGAARAAAYQNAHALVLPSFSEGLPMGVLEGWAHSLPVLMTRHCHLPEGFSAGAALPIEPEPASIGAGLHALFEMKEEELRETGRRGRELVAARFSWSQVAAALHDVYRWMLGTGPQPCCVVTA